VKVTNANVTTGTTAIVNLRNIKAPLNSKIVGFGFAGDRVDHRHTLASKKSRGAGQENRTFFGFSPRWTLRGGPQIESNLFDAGASTASWSCASIEPVAELLAD
jgi:hypothetical protein